MTEIKLCNPKVLYSLNHFITSCTRRGVTISRWHFLLCLCFRWGGEHNMSKEKQVYVYTIYLISTVLKSIRVVYLLLRRMRYSKTGQNQNFHSPFSEIHFLLFSVVQRERGISFIEVPLPHLLFVNRIGHLMKPNKRFDAHT